MTNTPPVAPATRSAAAERMRMHRERRRRGLRCLMIQLRETEIESLVRMGLLKIEMRHDAAAIVKAIHVFFDHSLGPTP